MQENDQKDRIILNFFEYLKNINLSNKTYKNYKSDINHFTGWFILRLRAWGITAEKLSETVPFITNKTAHEYKLYLVDNNISINTINRRFSTLRHLAKFLTEIQILDFDFTQNVENISSLKKTDINPLVINFQKHLEAERVSKNTVKNYVSDVKQFLTWLEANNETHSTN